jgi:hypothetical protein
VSLAGTSSPLPEPRSRFAAFLRAALTLLYNRLTKQDTAPARSVV